ncbi:hypothetical protein BGP_0723 [Beggiatoa sp. PS]|nr:hypothetical protein BGP_0723 [Beggiatoa sp. PS]
MEIDTLFYGENPYKAMALLGDHPLNRSGNQIINHDEINEWLKEEDKGLNKFRERVRDIYPVAIIGSFLRRDYISTRIKLPNDPCPENSVFIPYVSMHNWQKCSQFTCPN